MRPLIIVYDEGAAQPGDIAVGLAESVPCLYAVASTDHARTMAPLLAQFGPVVQVDDADRATESLAQHRPGGIVTFSERALPLTAALAARLGLPYHDLATVERLTDKWAQRAAFRAAGIDSVRAKRVSRADEWAEAVAAVGLPAVLKPANGGASRNTFLVQDADAGEALVRSLLSQEAAGYVTGGALVLEEYLGGRASEPFGDYVSVENVVCNGTIIDVAVTGKLPMIPPFRETGRFWPAPLDPPELAEIQQLARRAVAATGVISGITHTEIKLTPRGLRLIEVNGRLGGGINELARRAIGVDLIEIAGRVALGQDIGPLPELPRAVHFQRFHPAPRRPCRLLRTSGEAEVRRLPGVALCRPYERPGARLPGGVHTHELGIVIGRAADHDRLAALVEQIVSTLRFDFAFDHVPGVCSVTAAELARL